MPKAPQTPDSSDQRSLSQPPVGGQHQRTTSADTTHLSALELGLSHERSRLSLATSDAERELRKEWVAQREREIAAERAFLGMPPQVELPPMSEDELLAALTAP